MNNVAAHKTGDFTEKVLLITQAGNEVTGWCRAEDITEGATVQWSERPFKHSATKGDLAVFGEVVSENAAPDVVVPPADGAVTPVVPLVPAASSTSSAPDAAGTGMTPGGQSQGQQNTPPPELPTSSDGQAKTDESASATRT